MNVFKQSHRSGEMHCFGMGKYMKQAQKKDFKREIKKSLNRFLSILFIVALGVAFFAGVRSSEPDMKLSADYFYDSNHFMDIRVLGTLGMTEEDVERIAAVDGIEAAEGAYQTEAFCYVDAKEYIMLVYSLCENLNQLELNEGRLPEKANECLVDNSMRRHKGLEIGDSITLSLGTDEEITDTLQYETYEIVGFCTYAEYLSWTRPSASIGSGKSDAYVFLPKDSFTQDTFYTVYATVAGAEELQCYSDEYEELVTDVLEQVEAIAGECCELRYTSLVDEAQSEIDANTAKVTDAENELAKAESELSKAADEIKNGWEELETKEQELNEAKSELESTRLAMEAGAAQSFFTEQELAAAMQQYNEGISRIKEGEDEINQARSDLNDAEAELLTGRETYEQEKTEAEPKLKEARQKLADAQESLDSLEYPEWYVLDRNSNQSFVEYEMDSERIGAIGEVFPIIFFLVAALVSLTTMTRMVEENRMQIGTYKALGYGKGSISAKYFLYALYASLLGGALGVAVGSVLLPYVIINSYAILYSSITVILTPINWGISTTAVLLANACTVLAAIFACYKELASVPAVLMRPPAPASGKRVFLERIPFIWKHLSFSWKATIRNLFRYKKRLFMTILGIGGCTALLLVGFGLRDSIQEIVNNQYRKLWTYDISLSIEKDETLSVAENLCFDNEEITDYLYGGQYTMSAEADHGDGTKSIQLFVPQTLEQLDLFVVLRDRVTDEVYKMPSEGVVVTEKLASMLQLSVGDTIYLKKGETEEYPATVSLIVENYLYHYVYMTGETYEKVFGEPVEYNRLYLKTKTMTGEEKTTLNSALMEDDRVTGVTMISEMEATATDMMTSLDLVIWVLIVSAALLAFIVIYNLNNINIVERRRELATLKVLGFYDGEVANYVYRENIILTLLGILFGMGIGIFLHRYVIQTCEIDMIMFGRQINGISYILSALMTILFAGVVNLFMFYKLRKIDMVESLKSVE